VESIKQDREEKLAAAAEKERAHTIEVCRDAKQAQLLSVFCLKLEKLWRVAWRG
jgi:hypothetical protein